MKVHTPECHSKYITWGGAQRPCNCGGGASIWIAVVIAVGLIVMLVIASTITGGSFGHH